MTDAEMELMMAAQNKEQTKEIMKEMKEHFVSAVSCEVHRSSIKEKYIDPINIKLAGAGVVITIALGLVGFALRKVVFG